MWPRLLALVAVFQLCSCAQTGFDHPTSVQLQRELIEKSKKRLALARFSESERSLDLRFFDDHREFLKLNCCWPAQAQSVSRNRVTLVDLTSSSAFNPLKYGDPLALAADYAAFGGPVTLLDPEGNLIMRSIVHVKAERVSVSPDEKRFAFIGHPRGHTPLDFGVYVADFQEPAARKVLSVAISNDPNITSGWSIDWSPDNRTLLLSNNGAILLVDSQTTQLRKIADGSSGRWSPAGDWITYTTRDLKRVLLNASTGESRIIDPSHGGVGPLEWSPDGEYLLIPESKGSHVPFGCLWVYRISDRAYVPIPNYGMAGARPFWIQLK